MTVYARKVTSDHSTFQNREIVITVGDGIDRICVPDDVTLCNGCNQNIAEGYLVYLSKKDLKANQPYDYYCAHCLKCYFKQAVIVE